MHRSDPQLIEACRQGDQAAWRELVDRYGRLVYSIPRRYGLGESDADDVFAAVWATAFRRLDHLRDQTRLSAWLITTTHRESWRVGKRSASSIHLDERIQDPSSPGGEQVAQWEQQMLVRQALEQLGGRCQDLLTALFLEPNQPSYEAIAQRLGMSPGSIGPTRARCFKKLEGILVDLGLEIKPERPSLAESA